MPIVTVVKENKEGGMHVRWMEDMARGQQGRVKAQYEVEQVTKQLVRDGPSSGPAGAREHTTRKPW
jgi:hypothetical protein